MISPDNFIYLPYTDDLTRAGIAYACKRIPFLNSLEENDPIKKVRQFVADTSVELALQRYLNNENIPHNHLPTKHFSDPEHLTLIIGGRRCVICNTNISNKKMITQIRKNYKILLRHPAKVSENQIRHQQLNQDDIFIFTILECLITTSREACLQALKAKQPIYQIVLLPSPWSRATTWSSLGNLFCQYQYEEDLRLEIGGTDAKRRYLTEIVDIKSGEKAQCRKDFYNIHYLVTTSIPDGEIYLTSSALKRTITTLPHDWTNIWLYGLKILLVGYITFGKFIDQAKIRRYGRSNINSQPTLERYFSRPISHLSPLKNLFQQAKAWNRSCI